MLRPMEWYCLAERFTRCEEGCPWRSSQKSSVLRLKDIVHLDQAIRLLSTQTRSVKSRSPIDDSKTIIYPKLPKPSKKSEQISWPKLVNFQRLSAIEQRDVVIDLTFQSTCGKGEYAWVDQVVIRMGGPGCHTPGQRYDERSGDE